METPPVRVAVVGAGQFGRNHCRVVRDSPHAVLAAVADTDFERARQMAAEFGGEPLDAPSRLPGRVDAAIVAVPTTAHAAVASALMESGIDVLVEKPMAPDLESAERMIAAAEAHGRILQVGHLERFNPAVQALAARCRTPLFFEIHRLSVFSPRSLDIDVVLDLMIHDIDIVLALVGAEPAEIRAAGIPILSAKADIANVRLQFPKGCVCNLTASRVSTDRVRKLRLFQPGQYLSLDYTRQDLSIFSVDARRHIGFEQAPVARSEPLRAQFEAFLDAVRTRVSPATSGRAACLSLKVALAILDKIKEHAELVSSALVAGWKP